MKSQVYTFGNASTKIFFDAAFSHIFKITDRSRIIFLTDENLIKHHRNKFKSFSTIVIKAGESHKTQKTVDAVIKQLITFNAGRDNLLVGVGGGVVTDITGFIASMYMRGISFAFVPTSLLAMTDASIGGKNGIDIGVYKNLIGFTKQPSFILYDYTFLKTLPDIEWRNGFAEIIKHACIKDAVMFKQLQARQLIYFKKNKAELAKLINRNIKIKLKIVQSDEFENGERKILNFGHTIGHAIENNYKLTHGQAISIGMMCAAKISNEITGFNKVEDVITLLQQYGLPVGFSFNKGIVEKAIRLDKKRTVDKINFILLHKIGNAVIRPLSISEIKICLNP